MTHYHDITLTEVDSICEKLFPYLDVCDIQKLRNCFVHRNFKKGMCDYSTSKCCTDAQREKLLYSTQRRHIIPNISDDEWNQSCTYTSIHTMFAFCSLVIGINNGYDILQNIKLCIVCEEDVADTVSILLKALLLYTTDKLDSSIMYVSDKNLENDALYLHKLVNDLLEEEQHLHLLVLSPIDKMMVPGVGKSISDKLTYTALTGIVSDDGSISFPPMTMPPCFTGVIATITVESTLLGRCKIPSECPSMQVRKYSSKACICGHNTEYEEDVIHSHYIDENEEYSYDEDSSYTTAYFQNVGKPMPRSKFMNEINGDCLGCRVVARVYTSKKPKKKRSYSESEFSDDVLSLVKHIKV